MESTSLSRLKKPLLRTTVGLFGLSAVLGIFFILASPGNDSWRILGTTTLLSFFSLFTMNNLLRLDGSGKIKSLASIAIASNVVWMVTLFMLIWGLIDSSISAGTSRIVWLSIGLSICTTLTSSFMSMRTVNQFHISTKIGAIASAWLLYVYYLPAIIDPSSGRYLSDSWQFIAIMGIVFAFCAISAPIVVRMKSEQVSGSVTPPNALLRAQIEAELRPKIEAELRAQITEEMRRKGKDSSSHRE